MRSSQSRLCIVNKKKLYAMMERFSMRRSASDFESGMGRGVKNGTTEKYDSTRYTPIHRPALQKLCAPLQGPNCPEKQWDDFNLTAGTVPYNFDTDFYGAKRPAAPRAGSLLPLIPQTAYPSCGEK